jgi:hypothetical protein
MVQSSAGALHVLRSCRFSRRRRREFFREIPKRDLGRPRFLRSSAPVQADGATRRRHWARPGASGVRRGHRKWCSFAGPDRVEFSRRERKALLLADLSVGNALAHAAQHRGARLLEHRGQQRCRPAERAATGQRSEERSEGAGAGSGLDLANPHLHRQGRVIQSVRATLSAIDSLSSAPQTRSSSAPQTASTWPLECSQRSQRWRL